MRRERLSAIRPQSPAGQDVSPRKQHDAVPALSGASQRLHGITDFVGIIPLVWTTAALLPPMSTTV